MPLVIIKFGKHKPNFRAYILSSKMDNTTLFGNDSTQLALSNMTGDEPICKDEYHAIIEVRFILVVFIGNFVALLSLIQNSFLLGFFLMRKKNRNSNNLYLAMIAFFDVFISAAYMMLMAMNVSVDYYQSYFLSCIWFFYMVPVLTISHIAMTSSALCILAATYERFCITVGSKHTAFVQKNRAGIVICAIIVAVISKGSIAIEIETHKNWDCPGTINENSLSFADFVLSTSYNLLWRFWYRNIITIFLPFCALAYLNTRIVTTLGNQERLDYCADMILAKSSRHPDCEKSRRKVAQRNATKTLVFVVITYLFSNVVNVIVTISEHINRDFLVSHYYNVYTILLDLSSLLCVLASASRLSIYMCCQPTIRDEILELFREFLKKRRNYKDCTNATTEPLLCIRSSEQDFTSPDNTKSATQSTTMSPNDIGAERRVAMANEENFGETELDNENLLAAGNGIENREQHVEGRLPAADDNNNAIERDIGNGSVVERGRLNSYDLIRPRERNQMLRNIFFGIQKESIL
uniref:G_PROTEIN_RECEP_F1_2 domain-containing protein n=1 Tax=Rhabditophanes sp. KR3021 TaxID=114890 RepID=A0AC35U3J3_9BILA